MIAEVSAVSNASSSEQVAIDHDEGDDGDGRWVTHAMHGSEQVAAHHHEQCVPVS